MIRIFSIIILLITAAFSAAGQGFLMGVTPYTVEKEILVDSLSKNRVYGRAISFQKRSFPDIQVDYPVQVDSYDVSFPFHDFHYRRETFGGEPNYIRIVLSVRAYDGKCVVTMSNIALYCDCFSIIPLASEDCTVYEHPGRWKKEKMISEKAREYCKDFFEYYCNNLEEYLKIPNRRITSL